MIIRAGSTVLVRRSANQKDVAEHVADNAQLSLAPEGGKRPAGKAAQNPRAVARRWRRARGLASPQPSPLPSRVAARWRAKRHPLVLAPHRGSSRPRRPPSPLRPVRPPPPPRRLPKHRATRRPQRRWPPAVVERCKRGRPNRSGPELVLGPARKLVGVGPRELDPLGADRRVEGAQRLEAVRAASSGITPSSDRASRILSNEARYRARSPSR